MCALNLTTLSNDSNVNFTLTTLLSIPYFPNNPKYLPVISSSVANEDSFDASIFEYFLKMNEIKITKLAFRYCILK